MTWQHGDGFPERRSKIHIQMNKKIECVELIHEDGSTVRVSIYDLKNKKLTFDVSDTYRVTRVKRDEDDQRLVL